MFSRSFFMGSRALSRARRVPLVRQFSLDVENARTFAPWNIMKESGCVSIALRPAEFENRSNYTKLSQPGTIFVSFAAKLKDKEWGYDWPNKAVFSLSLSEIGELLVADTLTLKHTGAMKGANDAGLAKTFELTPDESAKGFNVRLRVTNVQHQVDEMDLSVPMSRGELTVLRNLLSNSLQHLSGWSACVQPTIKAADSPWDNDESDQRAREVRESDD